MNKEGYELKRRIIISIGSIRRSIIMISNKIRRMKINLESLGIYRNLLKDSVIEKLHKLINYLDKNENTISEIINLYNDFYYELMEINNGFGLKQYIINRIILSENIFSKKAQKDNLCNIGFSIKQAVANDLDSLESIGNFTAEYIKELFIEDENNPYFELDKLQNLGEWEIEIIDDAYIESNFIVDKFMNTSPWSVLINDLATVYKNNGIGIFGEYKGFLWEGKELKGVQSLDPIRLQELVNYERERNIIIDNTIAFLKGYKANNVLLYGSRGTGKSSTVKALLNEYYTEGLRVIEIPKQYISTFPKLIGIIKDIPQKFILFIDDLAFEDSEDTYTALKAVLEGGLETKPDNIIIYATSNRRHLVKEKFSDRDGMGLSGAGDEVHAADAMQEKLSLSDRFGITVTFISPTQKEYLEIVDSLAKVRGIEPTEEIHKRAIQWEMSYNGRSPRTARQFVDWLEGEICQKKIKN